MNLGGQLAHDGRGGGDFADGFLFDPQAGENGGGHHRRKVARHDLPHQRQHFIVENFSMLDSALQGFLGGDGHDHVLRGGSSRRVKKLRSSAWPCSVRIDSG
jgi:hypothetical protein